MADQQKPPQSPEHKALEEDATRLGKFIQRYSAFLSSFVIGIAGLIATSIWQYKQSEIARRQAESQQQLAEIKAANDWRIERAEILAKNLQVLAAHGEGSVDQRYGVLLSLTRGNILDPELAVSYALELGKDNPTYMRSVLASTDGKSYTQLSQSFVLSCVQRYGVAKAVPLCATDKYADRSDAIAMLISDEMEAAYQAGKPGPLQLLKDERQVQASPTRLSWLFEPYLTDLYERRQWKQIERFESSSTGARLVGALVLATARTGEFVTADEAQERERFHADRRKWLAGYLFGPTCDGECKGKLVELMLSVYGEAQGDYDDALKKLLLRPRVEVGPAMARLHGRLLWCQVDADDLSEFRDRVLVPGLSQALAAKADAAVLQDIAGLLAMVPEPKEAAALAAWKAALKALQQGSPERYQKGYASRRAIADHERSDPPPAMKRMTFCNAADAAGSAPRQED
jgi:hypothetical protein